MGFYGNIVNNINGSTIGNYNQNFQFDKIFSNRFLLNYTINSDNIYLNRSVLVDYDQDLTDTLTRGILENNQMYKHPESYKLTQDNKIVDNKIYYQKNQKNKYVPFDFLTVEEEKRNPLALKLYEEQTNIVKELADINNFIYVIDSQDLKENAPSLANSCNFYCYKDGQWVSFSTSYLQENIDVNADFPTDKILYIKGDNEYIEVDSLQKSLYTFENFIDDVPLMGSIFSYDDVNNLYTIIKKEEIKINSFFKNASIEDLQSDKEFYQLLENNEYVAVSKENINEENISEFYITKDNAGYYLIITEYYTLKINPENKLMKYKQEFKENNNLQSSYYFNSYIDKAEYQNSNYDSTVWQKIKNNNEFQYNHIADLNAENPIINMVVVPPNSERLPNVPALNKINDNEYQLYLGMQPTIRVGMAEIRDEGYLYKDNTYYYMQQIKTPQAGKTAYKKDGALYYLITIPEPLEENVIYYDKVLDTSADGVSGREYFLKSDGTTNGQTVAQSTNVYILNDVINKYWYYDKSNDEYILLTEENYQNRKGLEIIDFKSDEVCSLYQYDKGETIKKVTAPASIYFNKDGFNPDVRVYDNNIANTINFELSGKSGYDYDHSIQYYQRIENIEDFIKNENNNSIKIYELLEHGEYIPVDRTAIQNTKTYYQYISVPKNAKDINELKIHLPAIGNLICTIWDTYYGTERNQLVGQYNANNDTFILPEGFNTDYNSITGVLNKTISLLNLLKTASNQDVKTQLVEIANFIGLISKQQQKDGWYSEIFDIQGFISLPENQDIAIFVEIDGNYVEISDEEKEAIKNGTLTANSYYQFVEPSINIFYDKNVSDIVTQLNIIKGYLEQLIKNIGLDYTIDKIQYLSTNDYVDNKITYYYQPTNNSSYKILPPVSTGVKNLEDYYKFIEKFREIFPEAKIYYQVITDQIVYKEFNLDHFIDQDLPEDYYIQMEGDNYQLLPFFWDEERINNSNIGSIEEFAAMQQYLRNLTQIFGDNVVIYYQTGQTNNILTIENLQTDILDQIYNNDIDIENIRTSIGLELNDANNVEKLSGLDLNTKITNNYSNIRHTLDKTGLLYEENENSIDNIYLDTASIDICLPEEENTIQHQIARNDVDITNLLDSTGIQRASYDVEYQTPELYDSEATYYTTSMSLVENVTEENFYDHGKLFIFIENDENYILAESFNPEINNYYKEIIEEIEVSEDQFNQNKNDLLIKRIIKEGLVNTKNYIEIPIVNEDDFNNLTSIINIYRQINLGDYVLAENFTNDIYQQIEIKNNEAFETALKNYGYGKIYTRDDNGNYVQVVTFAGYDALEDINADNFEQFKEEHKTIYIKEPVLDEQKIEYVPINQYHDMTGTNIPIVNNEQFIFFNSNLDNGLFIKEVRVNISENNGIIREEYSIAKIFPSEFKKHSDIFTLGNIDIIIDLVKNCEDDLYCILSNDGEEVHQKLIVTQNQYGRDVINIEINEGETVDIYQEFKYSYEKYLNYYYAPQYYTVIKYYRDTSLQDQIKYNSKMLENKIALNHNNIYNLAQRLQTLENFIKEGHFLFTFGRCTKDFIPDENIDIKNIIQDFNDYHGQLDLNV